MSADHQSTSRPREAKINPKVAMWIGLAVATMAAVIVTMLFVNFGYQKGWWS